MLLTSACKAGQEPRDFPLPRRHVLTHPANLSAALPRVLRDLAHERRGYGPMVQLYADLDAESLRAEVRQFLTAAGLTCAPQGVVGQP